MSDCSDQTEHEFEIRQRHLAQYIDYSPNSLIPRGVPLGRVGHQVRPINRVKLAQCDERAEVRPLGTSLDPREGLVRDAELLRGNALRQLRALAKLRYPAAQLLLSRLAHPDVVRGPSRATQGAKRGARVAR